MQKASVFFMGTTLIAAVTSVYLYGRLAAERERADIAVQAQLSAESQVKAAEVAGESAQAARESAERELMTAASRASASQVRTSSSGLSAGAQTAPASAPTRVVRTIQQSSPNPGSSPAVMREAQVNGVRHQFGDLLRELNLSAEDSQKLIDMLADKMLMRTMNINVVDEDVLALLGRDRYALYDDYKKNLPEHSRIASLRGTLASARIPLLSDEQERRLYAAMIDEKTVLPMPTRIPPGASPGTFVLEWYDQFDRRILARAENILSPEQFAEMRQRTESAIRLRQQANMQSR